MLKNYFKIAWRNLVRNKTYSTINVVGLSIGIMCGVIIGIYILNEVSYDRFFPRADHIYRVFQEQNQAGDLYQVASTPAPLVEKLGTDYPEVELATGFSRVNGERLFQYRDKNFEEDGGFHIDSNFFELFPLSISKGSISAFFASPGSIIITQQMAHKYFADENPIGKRITINQREDVVVQAVLEDLPSNIHLTFNYLLPMQNLQGRRDFENWGMNWMYTYIVLKESANPDAFEQKIRPLLSDNIDNPAWQPQLYLQPLTDIHLYSDFDFNTEFAKTSDLQTIYLFGAIGLIIIFISCINFVNLSTARSFERGKEIGVRKVMGASRKQLVYQLIGESMIFAFLSTFIALAITQVSISYFASLSGIPLSLHLLPPEYLIPLILIILFSVGVLSGLYPSFFLSAFSTTNILKGSFKTIEGLGKRRLSLRKILVVSQFALSVMLIIGAIIIRQQMDYVLERNVGFDQEHVIFTPVKAELRNDVRYESLKSTLLQQSSVLQVTQSNSLPINHEGSYSGIEWEGMPEGREDFLMNYLEVDDSFAETFGLEISKGKNFQPRNPGDTLTYYLVNETALKVMQLKDPVGKRLEEGKIVGVVKDFNFQSAFKPIEPLMLRNSPEMFKNFISIKIAPGNMQESLATIGNVFKEFDPEYPFDYHFMDESIEALYNQQITMGKLIDIFAVLAILISCLGLFGLSTFTSTQRIKEIGIRKVLGATISDIVNLLSKDFLILIVTGFLIAVPVAWYVMNQWLTDFAYRIEFGMEVFFLAGIIAVLIGLLTVSYYSIKTAMINPAESLRSE